MQSGSISLFRIAGIRVYLHFSWFIVAAYIISVTRDRYHVPISAAYAYLALFAIVLLHEFGHAFACRSTGGRADQIVLWPLGGVAFVSPPPRPGAMLWSIVAGPLVNVALIPLLMVVVQLVASGAILPNWPDGDLVVRDVALANTLILIFNLLPIYPLDGGQIVRALLWFPFGRIRSLQIATGLGMLGGAALGAYAFYASSIWLGVLAFFLISQAASGWQHAKALQLELEEAERIRSEPVERPLL